MRDIRSDGNPPPELLPPKTHQGEQEELPQEAVALLPVPSFLLPSPNPQSPLLACAALITLPCYLTGFPWAVEFSPAFLDPASDL